MAKSSLLMLGLTLFAASAYATVDYSAHFGDLTDPGSGLINPYEEGLYIFQIIGEHSHYLSNNCGKLPLGPGLSHVLYTVELNAEGKFERNIFYWGNNDHADDLDDYLDQYNVGDLDEVEIVTPLNEKLLGKYQLKFYYGSWHTAGITEAESVDDRMCLYKFKGETAEKMGVHEVPANIASVKEGDAYYAEKGKICAFYIAQGATDVEGHAATSFGNQLSHSRSTFKDEVFFRLIGGSADQVGAADTSISDAKYKEYITEQLEVYKIELVDTIDANSLKAKHANIATTWEANMEVRDRKVFHIFYKKDDFAVVWTPPHMSNEQITKTIAKTIEFLQVKGVQREVPIHMTEGHAESYEVRVLDVYTKLQALYEAQPLVGKRQ